MSPPLVSIVIPTWNCVDVISDCLASLKAQTYSPIEIIGVDASSTDGTAELMAYATQFHSFVVQPYMVWGTPYQYILGAGLAKGKFLYFVDSDMQLESDAVETYVHQMEATGADALTVPEVSFGEGFWAKCKVLERSAYLLGDNSIETPRFMLRVVWDELGGYDPDMGGMLDWDFQNRLRAAHKETIRGLTPVYHNEGRLTLRKLVRKKFTYGKTAGVYLRKYWRSNRNVSTSQFTLLRPVYFRRWRIFIKDPIHTLGFIIMKLSEGVAFGAGFIRYRGKAEGRASERNNRL